MWQGVVLWQNHKADDFEQYDLLISGKNNLTLFSLNNKQNKAYVYIFPKDLHVRSAFGYGSVPIGSVYALAQLDGRGDEALKTTIFSLTSIYPADLINTNEDITKLKFPNLAQINLIDRVFITYRWWNLRKDKIVVFDFNAQELVEEFEHADGSRVKFLSSEKFLKEFANVIVSREILEENLRINIINGTKVNGLGGHIGSLLSGRGISVVRVESDTFDLEHQCRLDYSDNMISTKQTVFWLTKTLKCETNKVDATGQFDAIILLGDKMGTRFN